MNIEFHHAVTYICARLAGFTHEDAEIVAYSAQYVDDAVGDGLVFFENGACYARNSTAHKGYDYKNLARMANRFVWIPYHFIPSNDGLAAGEEPDGPFVSKLITRPDSPPAQDMMQVCVEHQDRPYSLHRLGIAAHAYADTWAHQGFAGIPHEINCVSNVVRNDNSDEGFRRRVSNWLSEAIGNTLPLGHGAALGYPDLAHLVWSYRNGLGETVQRNNPSDFVVAAHKLCQWFQRYKEGNAQAEVPGLDKSIQAHFYELFSTLRAENRHAIWLHKIKNGSFGFQSELQYLSRSWKDEVFQGRNGGILPYPENFLDCNWKLFHDAAKAHRRCVVDDILPQYGICVA